MSRGLAKIICILFVLCFPLTFLAGVHTHQEAGLQFEVPDDWDVKWNSPDICVTSSQGGVLGVNFHIVPLADVDASITQIDANLKGVLTDVKTASEKEVTINGLPGSWTEADALMYGEAGKVILVFLRTDTRMAMVYFFITKSEYPRYKTTIESIAHSVRPMGSGVTPEESIFFEAASTPEAAAMRSALFMTIGDVDELDKTIHWPSINKWFMGTTGEADLGVQVLRDIMLGEFRRSLPREDPALIKEGLLLSWADLRVVYSNPKRATVYFPEEYDGLSLEVGEFGGFWLLVELPQ